MEIIITLAVIFAIAFLLIFIFIYKENKKENEEEKASLFLVIFLSIFFSLIVAAVFGFLIFAILGATSIVNSVFSLNINTNQLIILTISFFIYFCTLDELLELIVKYMVGKMYVIIMAFIRIGIFYLIGNAVGLNQNISIIIATGVAVITLILEILYNWREANK